jgi:phage baseplate assembly protein V
MKKAIEALTEDVRNKTRLMVGRGILTLVDDTGAIQISQVHLLSDEIADDVERIQEYGFTSVPKSGAEAVVVFAGGNRDHGLTIAVDDRRYRLKALAAGEVAIYDDLGQKVHLTRTGIVVDGGGLPMLLTNTPLVTIDSKLHVTGDLTIDGNADVGESLVAQGDISDQGGAKSMAGMRGAHNEHEHPNPEGGNVGLPTELM